METNSDNRIGNYFDEYFNFFENVLIESGILNIFYDKLVRQTNIILKYLLIYRGIGYLEAATGFGKTYVAIFAIKKLQNKNPNAKVIVVVPSLTLYQDWTDIDGHINNFNIKNIEVYIVNTYTTGENYICDLLIADELHHYCSTDARYFNKVLDITNYKYLLGLSATLSKEEKEFLNQFNIPRIDEVSLRECELKGFISEFTIYNLGMNLNEEEREAYNEVSEVHSRNLGRFMYFDNMESNWKLARACASPNNSYHNIEGITNSAVQWRNWYARQQRWDGTDHHAWSPRNIAKYASQWSDAMSRRKFFIYKHTGKAQLCCDVIEYVNGNTIVFSESTEFADLITHKLGKKCKSYHSNLDSLETLESISKKYKTLRGAKGFNKKVNGELVSTGTASKPEYIVTYQKTKKIGKARLKRMALEEFNSGEISVLSTARSLDEGFNVDNIRLVIIASGSSKRRQYIQRIGRAVRFVVGKKAIIVNVYIKDTKDEDWLKSRQKKSKTPIWIDDVNDIKLESNGKGIGLLFDDN